MPVVYQAEAAELRKRKLQLLPFCNRKLQLLPFLISSKMKRQKLELSLTSDFGLKYAL